MAIAALGVHLSDRTSPVIWKYLDERTMNAQLAVLLSTPSIAFNNVKSNLTAFTSRYLKPTSKETGRMVFAVVIMLLMVITYDLTHNSIPAGGVESPQQAEAADGWLGVIDNRTNGTVFTLHDLSNLDNVFEVQNISELTLNSTYSISSNYLAIATESAINVYFIGEIIEKITTIQYSGVEDIFLTKVEQRVDIIAVSDYNLVHFVDVLNVPQMNYIHNGTGIVAAVQDSEYIYSADDLEFEVRLGSIATFGETSFVYNASSSPEQEAEMESWGQSINLSNASILQLDFDQDYFLINVNLTSTDRIVLVDRTTGNSSLVGDPKYSQTEPEIGYGYVVWSSKDNLDPNNPSAEYLDGEIFLMDLQTGITEAITADSIHQTNPSILEEHIVYLETNSQGESVVRVLSREVILQPYSNMALQIGLFVLLGLTFVYVWQRQVENRIGTY